MMRITELTSCCPIYGWSPIQVLTIREGRSYGCEIQIGSATRCKESSSGVTSSVPLFFDLKALLRERGSPCHVKILTSDNNEVSDEPVDLSICALHCELSYLEMCGGIRGPYSILSSRLVWS